MRRIHITVSVVILALVTGSVFAGWASKSAQINASRSDAERQLAKLEKDVAEAEDDLHAANLEQDKASSQAVSETRQSATIRKSLQKLNAERTALRRSNDELETQIAALVVVPEVEGLDEGDAIVELGDKGLNYVNEYRDGSCADYDGHFLERGFTWDTVYNQKPDPGTRVNPGALIRLYFFDRYSNWEIGC